MLKSYIKKIVKSELAKEKLNKRYGKSKSLVMHFNDAIHQQNNELSKLYNTNSSLKEAIENLEGKLILKGNLLSELKQEYEKLKQENEKLKIYLKKSNDYAKSLEQENKELSSKDFTTNDIHIVQLEDANYKIETIGNMVEKLINEKQMLEEKLAKISSAINPLRNTSHYGLLCTIDAIKTIIKES